MVDLRTSLGSLRLPNLCLASTDMGRAKWVEAFANRLDAPVALIHKKRLSGSQTPVPGIYAGRLAFNSASSFRLVDYTVARGVSVSGTVKLAKLGVPLQFQGLLTISGSGGAHGILGLNGKTLRGTLGGVLARASSNTRIVGIFGGPR